MFIVQQTYMTMENDNFVWQWKCITPFLLHPPKETSL